MAILRPKEAMQRLKVAIQRPIVARQQLCQEAVKRLKVATQTIHMAMLIPKVAI